MEYLPQFGKTYLFNEKTPNGAIYPYGLMENLFTPNDTPGMEKLMTIYPLLGNEYHYWGMLMSYVKNYHY